MLVPLGSSSTVAVTLKAAQHWQELASGASWPCKVIIVVQQNSVNGAAS